MADTLDKVKGHARAGDRPTRDSSPIVDESGRLPQARATHRDRWRPCAPLVAWAFTVLACRAGPGLPTVSGAWDAWGTVFSIAAWGPDSARLRRAADQARDSVRLVDSLLSTDDSGSELARVNRRGGGDALSPAFLVTLGAALDAARRAAVALDGTGPDWRRVRFDSAAARVALPRGRPLGLEWTAMGYALDRALLPLLPVADSAVLSMGGQYLIMSPAGRGARGRRDRGRAVGVVDPANTLETVATIAVPPGTWAVSTMSLVERPEQASAVPAGPERGGVRAVTTLAPRAVTAQAWSMAFFQVGCDSALALARGRAGVDVLCVDERVRWSAGLEGRVRTPRDSAAATAPAPAPGPVPAGAPAGSGSRSPAANPGSSR